MKSFQIESHLRLRQDEAWEHAISPRGVNAEFWPILRMTFPVSVIDISEGWQPGRRLFRSWILLFYLLPIEYDDVALAEVDDGRRFLEQSEMLTQKSWQHERELFETSSGVRIVDRITFISRIAALEPIQLVVFRLAFKYRHFRLRRLFGHDAA